MDPLTAFSLFCNIVTTVEAAIKAGKQLKQLYDSPDGLDGDKALLLKNTSQFRKIAAELGNARRKLPTGAQAAPVFIEIAKDCVRVTDQIDAILSQCQVGGLGPRRIAVVKAWVRSRKKRPELERLLSELQLMTQILQTSIAAASQADIETIKEQVYKHGVQQSKLIETLAIVQTDLVSQKDLLTSIQRVTQIFEEVQDSIRHVAILKALKSSTAELREEEIREHHPKTFDWILGHHEPGETPWTTRANVLSTRSTPELTSGAGFVQWLKGGSGVYHIAGKPGSGKSTLMKFLASEPAVREYLNEWARSSGKQLILSKFFFWKYGSDDQKSVRGLLRGLLHDMSKDNPHIAKALFPKLWGDSKHGRLPAVNELAIKGSDIKAAFERLRIDQGLRQQFRVCLFIDGVDEFDGKEMSHSRLAREIRSWTKDPGTTNFIKVCLSSREEYPIMSAFPACQRIHLQDLTSSDILAMVESTLEANEAFLDLRKGHEMATNTLVSSIVRDAEGVFLWVVLLLKLLEDELASGISSIASLQNIVGSTPSELEEFLDQILGSIHNHHKYGAHFVLAMALRMVGVHLSEDGSFDKTEQAIYEKKFKYTSGLLACWKPFLPAFGVGMVLSELENNNIKVSEWSSAKQWMSEDEYRAEALKAATKVKSWCRGLLDAPDEMSATKGSLEDLNVWFAHRSIPDFLASVMPTQARLFGFNDDEIGSAILAVTLAQVMSTEVIHESDRGAHEAARSGHVLRLLRLRRIPDSSPIPRFLDELDIALFEVYRRFFDRWWPEQGGRKDSLENRLNLELPIPSKAIRGDQQILTLPAQWSWQFSGEDGRVDPSLLPKADYPNDMTSNDDLVELFFGHPTVLAHACHVGLVEYTQWKLNTDPVFTADKTQLWAALYGLMSYFWVHSTWSASHNSLLRLLLAARSPFELRFPPYATPICRLSRIYTVSRIRRAISECQSEQQAPSRDHWMWPFILSKLLQLMTLSIPVATPLWDMLEVYLEYGALPPLEVVLERFENVDKPGKTLDQLYFRIESPEVYTEPHIHVYRNISDFDSIAYMFFRMPVLGNGPGAPAVEIWYLRMCSQVTEESITTLAPKLQTSDSNYV